MRSFGTIRSGMVAGSSDRPARGMPSLPVAKARKMSPLPSSQPPPIRPSPMLARLARRSHWVGKSGASVARATMIEPAPAGGGALPSRGEGGRPVVGHPAAVGGGRWGGGGADAPFDPGANPPPPPAEGALGHGPAASVRERLAQMLGT